MIRLRIVAALVAAGALAACGRDAAGPSTQLRSDEAQTLALGLAGSARPYNGSSMAASGDVVASSVAATAPFSISVDESLPCPKGGTLAVKATTSGQFGRQPFALTADMTGTIAPNACAWHVKAGTLTVTGDPNVAVTAHVAAGAVPNPGVDTFSAKGTLDWSTSDGRSGTCAIDYAATGDFGANTRTVRGTICGNSFDFTGTLF